MARADHCTRYRFCWRTVNVWPATVIVPVRSSPLFTVTAYVTVPLPMPDAPCVMVSQSESLDADHAHVEADAVTENVPVAAVAASVTRCGEMENVHGGGAAA